MSDRGEPQITRCTAWVLALGFVLLLLVPMIWQAIKTPGKEWLELARLFWDGIPKAEELAAFEATLARESATNIRARRLVSEVLLPLGQSSGDVIVGRGGFLFYRNDIRLASSPGYAPQPEMKPHSALERSFVTIAHLDAELKARGIHLIVAPIPPGPTIYPDRVWRGYPRSAGPAWPAPVPAWIARLRAAGVDAIDLAPGLFAAREKGEVWFPQDTHWSSLGFDTALSEIADHARPHLPARPPLGYRRDWSPEPPLGAIFTLTHLPSRWSRWPGAHATRPGFRLYEGDQPAPPGDDEASVLLVGDSYLDLFPQDNATRGPGAALAYHLGQPVQLRAKNGATPLDVLRDLAAHPERLRGKKVVVWLFAGRFLLPENGVAFWWLTPLGSR